MQELFNTFTHHQQKVQEYIAQMKELASTQADIILRVQKELGINKYCLPVPPSMPKVIDQWVFSAFEDQGEMELLCDGYNCYGSDDFHKAIFVISFVLHPLIVAGNTVGYEKAFRAELVEYADRNLR